MNVKGVINKIGKIQTVSEKFCKRELWLDVKDDKYSQTLCIEFVNDKTGELDSCSVGDTVDVSFNLRGRIVNDKCYNTIQGWKIVSQSVAKVARTEESQDLPF